MVGGGPASDFGGQRLTRIVYRMWDGERHNWRIENRAPVIDVESGAVLPEL